MKSPYKKSWLLNKTVLVTGVTSGMGRDMTLLLTQKYGCHVIGVARRVNLLEELKNQLGDSFDYFTLDVQDYNSWQTLKQNINQAGFRIDALINNAGVVQCIEQFSQMSVESIHKVMDTNFYSVVYGIKTFLDDIIRAKGAIMNTCSASAYLALPGMSVYCASKSAMSGLLTAVRAEVPKGVSICAVYPGFVHTDLFKADSEHKEVFKDKDKKLIYKFSMPSPKAAKIIVKSLIKRKANKSVGTDAKLLKLMSHMPVLAPKMFENVMLATHMSSFEQMNNCDHNK